MGNLEQILRKRFLYEETKPLAKMLLTASRKGRISYEEIKAHGGSVEDLLLAFNEKMLLPIRTSRVSKGLAWEDRILVLERGEIYEMPSVVRHVIKRAEETGRWEPDYAIQKYLEDIEEPKREEILELFRRIKKKVLGSETLSKTSKITPELLKEFSNELGLDINTTIAELKGGGIISPSLRNFRYKLLYEVNPSLYK